MNDSVTLLVIVVATAMAFDLTNGFHRGYRYGQIGSASLVSLAHGTPMTRGRRWA